MVSQSHKAASDQHNDQYGKILSKKYDDFIPAHSYFLDQSKNSWFFSDMGQKCEFSSGKLFLVQSKIIWATLENFGLFWTGWRHEWIYCKQEHVILIKKKSFNGLYQTGILG